VCVERDSGHAECEEKDSDGFWGLKAEVWLPIVVVTNVRINEEMCVEHVQRLKKRVYHGSRFECHDL
jgi:hypothetical protein